MDNLTKQTISTFLILFCNLFNLNAQEYFNLDFESRNTETNAPAEWYVAGNEYTISIDSMEKFYGEFSMKIESPKSGLNDFGVAVLKLPFDNSKNRQVKFKGKIKTELLEDGYAGLWMRVDGINGTLKLDNMSDRGYDGTNNWSDAEINLSIDTNAIEIYLGAVVSGTGKVWFDGFEIFIDNVKYIDAKPMLLEPTKEELSWLKEQIYPLSTYIPAHENTSDLKVLDSLIGNSEVIAFGESTHGSSEAFKMKYRVIEYLAQKNKRNIFSIKANMPEAYWLNEYTMESNVDESYKSNEYAIIGKDPASELIKGMGYWTWKTKEMLDLVKWMKDQNRGEYKIQYTGFDMQYFSGPIAVLRSALQERLGIYELILKIEIALDAIRAKRRSSKSNTLIDKNENIIFESFDSIKWHINNNIDLETKKEWLLQNCRLLEQYVLNSSSISHDRFMAENQIWIKNQNPDSQVYLWAHNEHIKKTKNSMGKYLSDKFGDNYISIGFAFYSGQYASFDGMEYSCTNSQVPSLGTYEYIFNKMEEPLFFLDLRQIKNDNSKFSSWFKTNKKLRKVGVSKLTNEFENSNLCEEYDFLIFIKNTTCSTILDEY